MDQLPLYRLNEFADLTAADREAFQRICGPTIRIATNQTLHVQDDAIARIFLLVEGWVISSVGMPDGQRQIVKIHLAGDILGSPSLALEKAAETLVAVTPATVRPIAIRDFGLLFRDAPRIAATMFLSAQQERVILMDRLASVGKSRAINRLAALLLHIHDRLSAIDPDRAPVLKVPLTQLDMGEMLGITSVHTNRTFRTLEETGFIRRDRSGIHLLDLPELRRLADLPHHSWRRNPDWLAGL